jgi:hypothetical protein
VDVSTRLDEFEGRLETYMWDVGVPELSEDDRSRQRNHGTRSRDTFGTEALTAAVA